MDKVDYQMFWLRWIGTVTGKLEYTAALQDGPHSKMVRAPRWSALQDVRTPRCPFHYIKQVNMLHLALNPT